MQSTFPAASTNRFTYTPTTYPLDSLTLAVARLVSGAWSTVTVSNAVAADTENESYYVDLESDECLAGLYRLTWVSVLDSQTRTDVEYAVCTEGEPVVLLATPGDLLAFDFVADGLPVGWSKLARASRRVARYARQTVIAVDADAVTLDHPYILPQRPVRGVTSVVTDGVTLVDGTDYTVSGGRLVMSNQGRVTVTYDHGFTTIPEELREVVCAVAFRMARAKSGLEQGVRSEGADGEAITYGTDAYAGVTDLTSHEKEVIDRIFPLTRKVGRSVDTL